MQATQVEIKSLELLEARIQRAVDLVKKLRDENDALRSQLASFQATASESAARVKEMDAMRVNGAKLEKELKALQQERAAVVARVDSLLESLEALPLD